MADLGVEVVQRFGRSPILPPAQAMNVNFGAHTVRISDTVTPAMTLLRLVTAETMLLTANTVLVSTGGVTVLSDSSSLGWTMSDETNLGGFYLSIDGGTDRDVHLPNPVVAGSGHSYSLPAADIPIFSGTHTLTIAAYDLFGVKSATVATLVVSKV